MSTIGEMARCERCGQDIQWLGREHGWRDRGNNRECPPYEEDGEIITPHGLKHRPYRRES